MKALPRVIELTYPLVSFISLSVSLNLSSVSTVNLSNCFFSLVSFKNSYRLYIPAHISINTMSYALLEYLNDLINDNKKSSAANICALCFI